MDIGAIVLHKLLQEKSLEAWSKLKLVFLDPSYSSLYTAINKYYNKYNCIPSFEDLELSTRDTPLNRAISSLRELEVPDVDIDLAIDALIDSYTQNETLKLVDKFIDTITLCSTQEIKDNLANIVMKLDEKTHTSETVIPMNAISIFKTNDSEHEMKFPLGLNNTFDSALGGAYKQELILVGGKRGAGKSLVCANLCANQLDVGNSAVYFTIEMTGSEIFERCMAIMGDVSHSKIRQNTLDFTDKIKLAKARASMFEEAEPAIEEFLQHQDSIKFESDLIRNYKLKDNQLVIIDDRELSITAVDLHLQKLKAQFGDKLKLAVIDYLNQITVPGQENGMYDWTTQIYISKKLKEFARKYDICILSPYQIDEAGGTRFAKGILDAADIALLLDAHTREDSAITFETTKIRGGSPLKFSSSMDWDTLKIDPVDIPTPTKKLETTKKEKSTTTKPEPTKDSEELPW